MTERKQEVQANEYAQLKQLVREKGLLDRQPLYYAFKIPFTTGLLALSIALLFLIHDSSLQLLNAVFMGVVFQQLAGIGHDLLHQQVTRSRRKNLFLGLLYGNLLTGGSREWWLTKHNRHHSNPNQLDMDPDIDIPLIAFTQEQALAKQGLARWVTRYQAFLLLPLTTLQGYALYQDSLTFLWKGKSRHNLLESVLIALHFVLYFGVIFYALGLAMGITFIVVQMACVGVFTAMIFAPNHKGMAIVESGSQESFLRRQVITARNLIPNPVIDFWYNGLNYQIEHHLFPDMPRNNLSKARPVVKAFCAEHGVPYYETGFFQSWREILQYLHSMGAPLRHKQPQEFETHPAR